MNASPPLVRVDDVLHRSTGSLVSLRIGEVSHELALPGLGEPAVEAALAILTEALTAGRSSAEALAAAAEIVPPARRMALRSTSAGALLIDDSAAGTPTEARAALRVLADLARGRGRSYAVLGELETAPEDWFEEHDALGRIIVRLDVSQLIVIGHGARHLHNAAGLEGSWDGESMLVESPEAAYDVLRARLEPEDVVLVTAGARAPLGALADRLEADEA